MREIYKITMSNLEMYNQVSRHLENNSNIAISSENEWYKKCVDFFVSNDPNVIIQMTLLINN